MTSVKKHQARTGIVLTADSAEAHPTNPLGSHVYDECNYCDGAGLLVGSTRTVWDDAPALGWGLQRDKEEKQITKFPIQQ